MALAWVVSKVGSAAGPEQRRRGGGTGRRWCGWRRGRGSPAVPVYAHDQITGLHRHAGRPSDTTGTAAPQWLPRTSTNVTGGSFSFRPVAQPSREGCPRCAFANDRCCARKWTTPREARPVHPQATRFPAPRRTAGGGTRRGGDHGAVHDAHQPGHRERQLPAGASPHGAGSSRLVEGLVSDGAWR